MKVLVWDLPTRLFHFALLVLVVLAWVSVEILDDMDLHFLCGYGILGLIIFRVCWGVVGTYHAKFSSFFRGPHDIKRYLAGDKSGYRGGNNPLGAMSVILLLGLIGAQAISGLFTDDEYYYFGPLNSYISSSAVDVISQFHHLNVNFIIAAVALHLVAIFYYQAIKREQIIIPMITGYKEKIGSIKEIQTSLLLRAIIVAAIAAMIVLGIASLEGNDPLY